MRKRALDGASLMVISKSLCRIYDLAEEQDDWKRARNALLVLLLCETGCRISKAVKLRVKAEEGGNFFIGAGKVEMSTPFLERLHSYYEWRYHNEADLIFWKTIPYRDELSRRQAEDIVKAVLAEVGYSWANSREIRNAVGRKFMKERGYEYTIKSMGFTRAEFALRLAEKK